jgi:hypothetical protein
MCRDFWSERLLEKKLRLFQHMVCRKMQGGILFAWCKEIKPGVQTTQTILRVCEKTNFYPCDY